MAISAVIIFFCTVLATLAIAFVIPADELNLAAGVMQAIQYFFTALNIPGAVAPMAVLITIGGVVSLAAWLIGPAKGLGVVAEEGNMPPLFNRTNKYGSPVAVLVIQALIGSFISLLYVFLPSVNQAYWILSAMTVELLCIVYLLVFACADQTPVQQTGCTTTLQDSRWNAGYLADRWHGGIRGNFCVHRRAYADRGFLVKRGSFVCDWRIARHIPACSSPADLPETEKTRLDRDRH